jgi:predicted nucleic-acid-binding protein
VLAEGDVLVLRSVILEAEWVLRSAFRLSRRRIATILRGLLGLAGVTIEGAANVARALDWFEAGLDFADAMHLAATPDGDEFVTFDRSLARRARHLRGTPPVREP